MDRLLPLLALWLLASCSQSVPTEPPSPRDPAIMAALSEPLLSDPDLVGASGTAGLLTGGGPPEGGVPLFGPDEAEAARARAEALDIIGGAMPPAPGAMQRLDRSPLARAATAAAVAQALPFAARCAPSLGYSFVWAARLPAAIPVYPRAHAQEAGGSDAGGCKLRVVNFRTPVSPNDVIAFYHAAADRAGLSPRIAIAGPDQVVSGAGGGLSFAVYVRSRADGMTEADLVTNG